LPWKRQVIDQSRGPVGTYASVHRSLPDLPHGVAWQRDEKTREWSLVRTDQQQERDRQQYKMEPCRAWNPHTGREQWSVKPVVKTETHKIDDVDALLVDSAKKNVTSDAVTVATAEDDNMPPRPPVLGVDYIVHTILPYADTFAGICLRYKIKAVDLRRINRFSGSNLSLAPSRLLIPLDGTRSLGTIKLQDTNSKDYKMQEVVREFPHLSVMERKAFLELNDWNLKATLEEIRQDLQWEKDAICVAVPLKALEVDAK